MNHHPPAHHLLERRPESIALSEEEAITFPSRGCSSVSPQGSLRGLRSPRVPEVPPRCPGRPGGDAGRGQRSAGLRAGLGRCWAGACPGGAAPGDPQHLREDRIARPKDETQNRLCLYERRARLPVLGGLFAEILGAFPRG